MANVRGLSDLKGEDDDDKRRHNDYYAGGEKSGQLLRGADSDSDDDEDQVGSLFQSARHAGAVTGTSADLPNQGPAFQGTGRKLTADGPDQQRGDGTGPRNHVITFWSNNIFTVDDGPPRSVEDPANFRFIESIKNGECPEELDPGKPGVQVTVNLVRKDEPYEEAKQPKQYFTGSGRTLGGGSGASTSTAAAAAAAGAAASAEWEGVNESNPTTSLQLRLPDGSRMVARFNHTHRVLDIRRFIRASRPDMATAYQIMTAFPNKVVEDESQTLEAAGLLNAVIIIKS